MSKTFFKKIIILIFIFVVLTNQKNIFAQNQISDYLNSDLLMQKKAELEQKIKEKNEELENINKELQNTQNNLEKVRQQKNTLQNEIKKLNQTIKQLELNIASDTATIEKLKLEIDSLNYDIENINNSINKKRVAIIKTLQEIQKSENKNILTIILANGSLADTFSEIQNLSNLKNQLRIDIENLSKLEDELTNKLELTRNKKEDIEIRKVNLNIRQAIVKDQQQEKSIILSQTKNQESLYQKQLAELQKQQEEIIEEIERIDAELRKDIKVVDLPPPQKGLLLTPIGGEARITQEYGPTKFASINYRGKWHNGVDYGAPIGTPVFAAENGTVIAVGNQDKYCYKAAYGKFIVIRHYNNLVTLYAHLSLQKVKVGDKVNRGQIIGYSGNSGWSTGPHLHFTVFAGRTFIMRQSRYCGLMPSGGDLNPFIYL